MPYLLKLTKNGEVSTRFAATAVQALVLLEVYAANGYSDAKAFDTAGNAEISVEELAARAGRAPD